ncbi:MAG: ArnT family glycosyltransferase, partial [Bacillota bacterium]
MSSRPLWAPLALASDAEAAQAPRWIVAVIAAMYVLPGLVGHDPWKPDEAYIFGVVYHMLQSGDWIVPQVAGVPFMEKPPMYHWVAMLTS